MDIDSALEHLHQALESGLIPTILYMPSEAEIFDVAPNRMLSICFCCECCCDVRLLLREGPDRYWDAYNYRLPGVRVVVGENCTLCGSCVEACYGGERVVRMGAEKAEVGTRCLGCGICVPACSEGAISLRFDSQTNLTAALLGRVSGRVQIGSEP